MEKSLRAAEVNESAVVDNGSDRRGVHLADFGVGEESGKLFFFNFIADDSYRTDSALLLLINGDDLEVDFLLVKRRKRRASRESGLSIGNKHSSAERIDDDAAVADLGNDGCQDNALLKSFLDFLKGKLTVGAAL